MTDLFATLEKPKPRVGYGNAMFLADLADNTPDAAMRAKFERGEYPDIHRPSITPWRALAGRQPKGTNP